MPAAAEVRRRRDELVHRAGRASTAAEVFAALVIEPAQPSAIASVVVEAYDLTDREQQIVRLIARGASTTEIADELFLSVHTVRDHVKAVFAKAEVSSRGELTAKLFAEFYEPDHATDITRAHHDPDQLVGVRGPRRC